MARKEITTPLDLKNMDNHNYNYEELYNLIDETDRRISEDMWEEIKDANTMKMLEPVQTAAELPSEMAGKSLIPFIDKSLITVIDEQRVYGFVNGEWQPFNQIDLDPFEPFKDELAAIVAAYEEQIQSITTEVQNTKTSAIESIESTQTDVESQISTIRDEMTTQASDLTALFNDSMDKLTSKQETALVEVDSAKQAAITALEDFNNTDTSNWQKYKLTESNGDRIRVSGIDPVELGTGFYQIWDTYNMPVTEDGSESYWNVDVFSATDAKQIRATLNGEGRVFQKNIHFEKDLGWKEITGVTRTVLFNGSASGVDSTISLSEPYDNFEYLFVSFNATPGRQTKIFEGQLSDWIVISVNNVYDEASGARAYEMKIERTDLTTLTIANEVSYSFDGSGSDDSSVVIEKIVGVK
ncbi:hypothetical protein I6G41_03435 [Staphylococcus equorum]|uniref:hypothetical protein n=1 Tax=Staphylococcus equorum TaxID=246432 RepID=UPI0018DA329A|nr:hypothetical protein [Staphylococcus equorum]QPT00125.1 hypothetical protein I6G41_03435 [Staphylococcus equorum]